MHTPPVRIPESQPLKSAENGQAENGKAAKNYGSFDATPRISKSYEQDLTPLTLPDPAISSAKPGNQKNRPSTGTGSKKPEMMELPPPGTDAYHFGPAQNSQKASQHLPKRPFWANRTASTPPFSITDSSPALRHMFTGTGRLTPQIQGVPLEAYWELDHKQDEFFKFLDKELDKIEDFYKMKEEEASERLQALRAQLHEMRDRRLAEVRNAQQNGEMTNKTSEMPDGKSQENGPGILKPLSRLVSRKESKAKKGMATFGSPAHPAPVDLDALRDYVKHVDHDKNVPYRAAKRKLKLALQEFYRALELLKSYALVNRTAFRKINKKYDKAVNARPTGRYMTEKVNKAYFVQSDVVDNYIVAVEDLYSRYFAQGNRKVAVGKLRSKLSRSGDYSRTTFRNGIFVAAGTAFSIQGLAYAYQHLNYHDNDAVRLYTSYLLQLYGGYFLGVLMFLLFTLDCSVWTRSKINYIFVFEYDTRNVLDWRQLAELPCFFLFLNGLIVWLNFRQSGEEAMYTYWPVMLVGITLIIMCIPLRILYHRSRKWWGYSNWRLLLAGLYPVEFRDFFLGDMYCSLTYLMGNIELFFCLYAHKWSNPPACNSTSSRLLGFFVTLPAIWRAFQCIRRYYDSRNWFPHLANSGKYAFTILYGMSLSLYRIDDTAALRGLFIFFATINAAYCSTWDIAMDWSLGNPYATYPFLRNTLGFHHAWIYYAAMVVDPILRFSWVFYAIFGNEFQHSTLMSFLIALAEVIRRGIWALFRVENEHCSNVGSFRASRDVPLPYPVESSKKESQEVKRPAAAQSTTGADVEQAAAGGSGSLRLRGKGSPGGATPMTRRLSRFGSIITEAHAQDFERRKRNVIVGEDHEGATERHHSDSSGDDHDDHDDNPREEDTNTQDMQQAREMLDRAQV